MTDDVAMDTGDIMDSDDADWYREEVGEEPDPGKKWGHLKDFILFRIILFPCKSVLKDIYILAF